MRISQKGLVLISLPLVFELSFFGMLCQQLNQSETAINEQIRAREVMALDDQLQRSYTCSLCSTFLYAGTRLESFRILQQQASLDVMHELGLLRKIFNRPSEAGWFSGTAELFKILRLELRWRELDLKEWFVPAKKVIVKRMMFLHKKRCFAGLMAHEQILNRQLVHARLNSVTNTYWIIGSALLLMIILAVVLSQYFVRSIAVRLLNVVQNTFNLSEKRPLQLPVSGNDEIAKLDQSIYRSAAEILELEQYRAQLTAIISHEVRTPLTSLRLVLLMLAQGAFGPLKEESNTLLNSAVLEAENVISLIQDLLFLERVESGVFKPESIEIEFEDLIEKTIEPLEGILASKKIQISATPSANTLWSDENTLSKALRCGLQSLLSCCKPNSKITVSCMSSNNATYIEARAIALDSESSNQIEKSLPLMLAKGLQEKLGGKLELSHDEGVVLKWLLPGDQAATSLPTLLVRKSAIRRGAQSKKSRLGFNIMLKEKGMILIMVPIFFVLSSLALFACVMQQADAELNKQLIARDILAEVARVELIKWDMLSTAAVRSGCSDDEQVADQFEKDKIDIDTACKQLRDIAKGKPDHERFVNTYSDIAHKTIDAADELVLSGLNDFAGVLKVTDALQDYCRAQGFKSPNPWSAEDEMIDTERRLLDRSVKDSADSRQTLQFVLYSLIFLSVPIAVGLGVYFNLTMIREINNIVQNSQRLLKHEALLPPLPGSDEIAILDEQFYKVAEKLVALRLFKQNLVVLLRDELMKPLENVLDALKSVANIEADTLSEKAKNRIRMGQNEVGRLVKLVNELLNIEKLQVGQIELQTSETSLNEIVDRAALITRPLADAKNITLKVNSLDLQFTADADRLIQVLVNLVSNAIKFSPEAATVEIASSLNGDKLEIKVIDQGRGVPAAHLSKIFEPFEQVEKSDASEKKGTGLGLFIVKSIIEAHSGTISVESIEGKGATFCILLPVATTPSKSAKAGVSGETLLV